MHVVAASYTAAIEDNSVDAVYARRFRAQRGAGERQPRAQVPPSESRKRDDRPIEQFHTLPRLDRLFSEEAVTAVVLHLAGCSLQVASDHAGVSIGVVKLLHLSVRPQLEKARLGSIANLFARADTSWSKLVTPACKWAFEHRWKLSKVLAARDGIRPYGAEIRLSGLSSLEHLSGSWKDLVSQGVQPLVFFGRDHPPDKKVAFRSWCEDKSISAQPNDLRRGQFAVMKFCVDSKSGAKREGRMSPHVLGKVGRLMVASMLVAAAAASMEGS